MCENCSEDSSTVDFQENSASVLCQYCYWEIFKDLIPGLELPKVSITKDKSYNPEVIYETKDWKLKRKNLKYSLLDGKWAREFIHLLDDQN